MPEGPTFGNVSKAKDFFDAAVAIGGNDQNRPREKIGTFGPWERNANDHVVVEFALLPVIEKLVPAETMPYFAEQAPQTHRVGKGLNEVLHDGSKRSTTKNLPG